MTSNFGSENNIPRPQGRPWEARRRSVLARNPLCVYCGMVPLKPVVAHVVALSEGIGLALDTTALNHPLNLAENLATSCALCNLTAGSLSIPSARRKIAQKLNRPVYDGPVPNTTRVEIMLEELGKRPSKTTRATTPKPEGTAQSAKGQTTPAPEFPYATVQEAMRDLQPFSKGSEDYNLVVQMINDSAMCERSCVCGGGVGGGRCIDSLDELDQRTI